MFFRGFVFFGSLFNEVVIECILIHHYKLGWAGLGWAG